MREQSWPRAGVGTVCTAPSGSFHMLYPRPFNFRNFLVPLVNVFLPCFFLSPFCQGGSGSCGGWLPIFRENQKEQGSSAGGALLRVLTQSHIKIVSRFNAHFPSCHHLLSSTKSPKTDYLLCSWFSFLWHPLALSREAFQT